MTSNKPGFYKVKMQYIDMNGGIHHKWTIAELFEDFCYCVFGDEEPYEAEEGPVLEWGERIDMENINKDNVGYDVTTEVKHEVNIFDEGTFSIRREGERVYLKKVKYCNDQREGSHCVEIDIPERVWSIISDMSLVY